MTFEEAFDALYPDNRMEPYRKDCKKIWDAALAAGREAEFQDKHVGKSPDYPGGGYGAMNSGGRE